MVVIIALSTVLVMVSVAIHYEALQAVAYLMGRLPLRPRRRLCFGVLGALAAHLIEAEVFAIGYYFFCGNKDGAYGRLVAVTGEVSHDYAYFSIVAFTSLGFGDVRPEGPVRYLVGVETLTGLVLIAWTASFMIIQMQKLWHDD